MRKGLTDTLGPKHKTRTNEVIASACQRRINVEIEKSSLNFGVAEVSSGGTRREACLSIVEPTAPEAGFDQKSLI